MTYKIINFYQYFLFGNVKLDIGYLKSQTKAWTWKP